MAEGKSFLCLDVSVGHYAHKRRHEYGHDTLHGKKPFDLRTEADVAEIAAEGSEVSTPCGILQEVHQDKPESELFVFHLQLGFSSDSTNLTLFFYFSYL